MTHRRYPALAAITSGSGEKIWDRGSHCHTTSAELTTVQTTASVTEIRTPCRARSSRPAPIFCPTKEITAAAMLWVGRNASVSSLLPTLNPAVKALPKLLTLERTNMAPRATRDIWIPLGRPMRMISAKSFRSKKPLKG